MVESNILWLDQCESTNDEAVKYLNDPHVHAIGATSQLAGRGRMGREWYSSPDSGLYFSWIARPRFPQTGGAAIPLLAAISTAEVCATLGADVMLKWPNDVLANGRKLAGILCEARGTPDTWTAIVGIGVNFKPPAAGWPVHLPAISLSELGVQPCTPHSFADALLKRLTWWLDEATTHGISSIISAWEHRGMPRGSRISRNHVHGIFRGLSIDGSLRIETALGIEVIHAGDVELVSTED